MSISVEVYTIIGSKINREALLARPVEGFDPEGGEHRQGSLGGLDIVIADERGEHCFLVYKIHESPVEYCPSQPILVKPDELGAARDTIRTVLKPLGIWDSGAFGVWTALHYN